METEILNKILTRVEKIGTDLTEFKVEMYGFRDEVNNRFDQLAQGVASEIHGLSKMINNKIEKEKKELKDSLRIRVEWEDTTKNKIHIL